MNVFGFSIDANVREIDHRINELEKTLAEWKKFYTCDSNPMVGVNNRSTSTSESKTCRDLYEQ